MRKKIKYTICWGKLIALYNKKNIGQISQSRLAELFDVSTVAICHSQTIPLFKENIEKRYLIKYNNMFSDYISLEELLTKHVIE